MRMAIEFGCEDGEPSTMKLTLEPASGGDLRATAGASGVVEQVKMRSAGRRWSTREVAATVMKDLLAAVGPGGPGTFRFVTDNSAGLADLEALVAAREAGGKPAPETIAKVADALGVPVDDERLARLLAGFEIVIVDARDVETEVEEAIARMLAPGQDASEKRHALTSRLLVAAKNGETLGAADLMAMIHPEALLRLTHANTLASSLAARLGRDCRALGYERSRQARDRRVVPEGALHVLSGESGQGKTWSACHCAHSLADEGEAVIVVGGATDFDGLARVVAERVAAGAYERPPSIPAMAARLRPSLSGPDGHWLTVFVDDVQDRRFAASLAASDWGERGVRLVVTCQPRIAGVFEDADADATIEEVGDFTSAELRRHLALHGRAAPLETMPDDVLELLLKPVHAKMFVQLPERDGWVGETEYELFAAYWRFATTRSRDQRDHPSDAVALLELVATALEDSPGYPFTAGIRRRVGMDDAAVVRLEQVGLVRSTSDAGLVFSTDRMLNWAVAERLASQVVAGELDAATCEQTVEGLDEIAADGDPDLGRRLGYVLHDLLWILASEGRSVAVADILWSRLERRPHDLRENETWRRGIGSIGVGMLPALEILASRLADDEHHDVSFRMPLALVAIAEGNPDTVARSVGRLIGSESELAVGIGLRTAARTPCPQVVYVLWALHLERDRRFDEADREGEDVRDRGELMHMRDLSSKAVRRAVSRAPEWLDGKLEAADEPFELDSLVWMLVDEDCLGDAVAGGLWAKHRERIVERLPSHSKALIAAVGHFGDAAHASLLETVPLGRDDWMSSRILRTRALVDPVAALRQIRADQEEHGWGAAAWWLPELVHSHPGEVSEAVRERSSRGENELTDLALHYAGFPELMDEATLERVLDLTEQAVVAFVEEEGAHERLGRLSHPLRLLSALTSPRQIAQLSARAGGGLERALVQLATSRRGRTSRTRDHEGGELERVLAAIDGEGYAQLAVAELSREDRFGREDGYLAALWTEDGPVRDALAATSETDPDGYRRVVRMHALAVHRLDGPLEEMVRAGAPIYVDAAESRKAAGRPLGGLRERIRTLLDGDEDDVLTALRLVGFLRDADDAREMLPDLIEAAGGVDVGNTLVASLNALGLYDPAILEACVATLDGGTGEGAQFVATYLARHGDRDARAAVCDWLDQLDLGTWSSSNHAFLEPLLGHEDSRSAVVALLRRSREAGHLLVRGDWRRILADEGDERASTELVRSAYRSPRFGAWETAQGILHLSEQDRDEAFFAARRLLARHGSSEAVDLLLHIDPEAATSLLVERFRTSGAATRQEIARRLRVRARDLTCARLDELAASDVLDDRTLAAELAGWMPPSRTFAWLSDFADDPSTTLRKASRAATARRAREDDAISHVEAWEHSSKPLRWVKLHSIFESVDPFFLWQRDDPASIVAMLEASPHEFLVEARRISSKVEKKLDDEARKADRDR